MLFLTMITKFLKILATNEMIEKTYQKDKDTQLIFTIPGIGVTPATLIGTEIDGLEHFSSLSKLCSYVGPVPSTRSSRGRAYHGRLASEGNR